MNLERHLPLLLDLGLKSAAAILVAFVAALAWRRASAANRHVIWLALLGTLLLLPLTELTHPHLSFFWQQQAMQQYAPAELPPNFPRTEFPSISPGAAITAGSESHAAPIHWTALGAMAWMSGAAILLLRRATVSWKMGRSARDNPQISDERLLALARKLAPKSNAKWELRESESCRTPLVFGVWRPVVLLPLEARDWTAERLSAVLLHEFGHVARRDCLTRLLMDFACAIYWVNPLVWIAARRMRIAQEQACDDIVLSAGVNATDYASQIVEIVRSLASERFNAGPALAMAQPSTLETRVRAIVDATRDRRPLSGVAFAGGSLAIFTALALCGAAQLRAADEKAPVSEIPSSLPTNAEGKTEVTSDTLVFDKEKGTITASGNTTIKTGNLIITTDKAVIQQTGAQATAALVADNPEANQVVATVNDRPITAAEVTEATRASDRSSAEARKASLEKLIDDALLVEYFRKMHYEIPAYFVDQRAQTILEQEFGGDQAKFEAALAKQGYTLAKFKKKEEEKIMAQEMRRSFSKTVTGPVEKKKAVEDWLAAARAKAVIKYN